MLIFCTYRLVELGEDLVWLSGIWASLKGAISVMF
ncbi:hypothetical protein SLEP1_g2378 [Rubroshorea leprosula]|uniref:Uncharacterized protein n=1 Tax=Rubroshorea leprosula TaxID=152421 RepID=A0AAV5HGY1_9ROSI|nr:hypothetical protein SLEP1_g2378 [Rubroshorea leprosula]